MAQPLNANKERPQAWRQNAFWFAIAVAAIAVAFYVESPYMAYAVYAFLLLVTLANVTSRAWVSGLECERHIGKTTLQQGEETEVEVTVTNRRGWPIPWLFIEDLSPKGAFRTGANTRLAILMPGRSTTVRYALQFPKRGYHRVGPTLLESGDVFGLQKRFRTSEQQHYVSVLPSVAYIESFSVGARRPQGPVRISNRIYEDPTRIASLREYQPGDPMSRIHWKASARTGQLFVKQNEPSNVLGATLILDLHDDAYLPENRDERIELAITTTASIAYLLQVSGEQLGMITNGLDAAELAQWDVESNSALSRQLAEDIVVGEGESDRISPLTVPTMRTPIQALRIIENLARVVPGHGLHLEDLILNEFRRLPRDASMLVVAPEVSPRLAEVLAEMQISGFAVSVFLIKNQRGYEEAASLLAPYNITVFHIEHERQLHELNPAKIGR